MNPPINRQYQKALITGASSGLGFEIAKLLFEKRTTIVNVSRTAGSPSWDHLQTDLSDCDSVARMVDSARRDHTDCDLLVLCAGVLHWAEAGENFPHTIENDIAINLTSLIKVVDGILPIIKKNNGDIVIIGSTSSFNAPPGSSVYVAAKHGVLGYIKALQAEFKNQNIRIIGVHPGGFKSQFHTEANTKIDHASLMDPIKIAELILTFLALPRSMEVSEIIINRKSIK